MLVQRDEGQLKDSKLSLIRNSLSDGFGRGLDIAPARTRAAFGKMQDGRAIAELSGHNLAWFVRQSSPPGQLGPSALMHELDHNNLVGLVEPLRGRGTWGNKFGQRVVQGRAGCPHSMGTGV